VGFFDDPVRKRFWLWAAGVLLYVLVAPMLRTLVVPIITRYLPGIGGAP
jgi:hypothetical protein